MALTGDGTVWGWGSNSAGQLGNGTTTDSYTPSAVVGISGVTAIASGGSSSFALRSDGTMWAWGSNQDGTLGDGTTTDRLSPVQVKNLSNVKSIGGTSIAALSDGTVWAWGANVRGELGVPPSTPYWTYSTTPEQVPGITNAVQVSGGANRSIALLADGTVREWGWNSDGELGNNSTTDSYTPVQPQGLSGVISVSGGFGHTLALRSDGTVWAWGINDYGQLGFGTIGVDQLTPAQVPGLSNVTAISAGYQDSYALLSDGSVRSWGDDSFGELANGTRVPPIPPPSGPAQPPVVATDFAQIAPSPPVSVANIGVSLSGPSSLTADTSNHIYTPSSFSVTATVTNTGPFAATTPEASLTLPHGFSLGSTDTSLHRLTTLAVNGSAQTTWQVLPPADDTTMPPSTFFVRVDAADAATWVTASYSIVVPPLEAPGAPTNVTATGGNGQAIITWTPPTTGLPITSYSIQAYAPDGVTPVATPVTLDGSQTSGTVTGLNVDCDSGRYRFAVFANNSLGPGPSSNVSATLISAGHPSDPPTSVAILVQGLGSSLMPDAAHVGYDPLNYSYCGLSDAFNGKIPAYDVPAVAMQPAGTFDPTDPAFNNHLANPNLTDLLALNGAVLLPFSYRGAFMMGSPGDLPAFYSTSYASSEPAQTLRDAAADQLWAEVNSVHHLWPNTSIEIIGHSNGGLVAETFWEEHSNVVTADSVKRIFAVDSPINGVNDPGGGYNAIFDVAGGGAPFTSGPLLDEYHQLWTNRQTRDTQLITMDQNMNDVFVPIGTYMDQLYNAADSTVLTPGSGADRWHGIDSQVLCTTFTINQDCASVAPPDVFVSGNPPIGSVLAHNIPSHAWAFTQQPVVNLLGNALLPTGAASRAMAASSTASTPSTGSTPPSSDLSVAAASVGSSISITGANLGTAAGTVTFPDANGNRVPGTVTTWSSAAIQVTVPVGAVTGEVYATTATGDESYSGGLTILAAPNGVRALTVAQTTVGPDGTPATVTVLATGALGLPAAGVPITPSSGLQTGPPVTTDATGTAQVNIADWGTTSLVLFSGTAFTTGAAAWTSPPPTTVSLTIPPGVNAAGAAVPVQATVTVNGQPAPAGTTVNFSISGADTATLSATAVTTDAQGHATTSASNTVATSAQVSANASNASAVATIAVTWVPSVTGVTPASGSTDGGTGVTITGSGFIAPAKVYFGTTGATGVMVVNATTITATAPATSKSGNVDVTVATSGGQSQTSSADTWTYTVPPSAPPVPTVSSITPTSGPAAGGTAVTVNGSGFTNGVSVNFGSVAGTNVVIVSATELTVTSPPVPAGTVDITVSGPGGTSATAAPDQYTFT